MAATAAVIVVEAVGIMPAAGKDAVLKVALKRRRWHGMGTFGPEIRTRRTRVFVRVVAAMEEKAEVTGEHQEAVEVANAGRRRTGHLEAIEEQHV